MRRFMVHLVTEVDFEDGDEASDKSSLDPIGKRSRTRSSNSRLNSDSSPGNVATISGRGRKLENLPAAKEAAANKSAEADHIAQRTRSSPTPPDAREHLTR